jgi:TolA-binding protein
MRKIRLILYISFALLLVFGLRVMAQDAAEDPFSFNSPPEGSDNPNEGTGEPALQDQDQGPSNNTQTMPAMTDSTKNQEGIEQSQSGTGVQAKQLVATPTPVSRDEDMFKQEVSVQQQEMTREQVEKDVDALMKEGMKYYSNEDYEGAAQIWERILQNYPTSKSLYYVRYMLASAYEYDNQYSKAIDEYQKVLGEKPKYEIANEAAYRLAGCYSKLEKWQFALEIYRDIVRRAPDKKESVRAYFNMAVIYLKMEKYKKVSNIYDNIIKYYPGSEWEIQARFQLASTYAQTNRYKSAINEYKVIKQKFRETEWAPRAALHIGDTYKLEGDYKNAKDAYNRVIYEFYKNEKYTRQAEQCIENLKKAHEIAEKYDNEYTNDRQTDIEIRYGNSSGYTAIRSGEGENVIEKPGHSVYEGMLNDMAPK